MKYRTLGNSGLQVSELSFGCMSLGNDSVEDLSTIHQAMDEGINFFDTADLYDKGGNEMLLGKAIQGFRDKILIATKVGNRWKSDGSGWEWKPEKKYILSALNESLKRLNTDYVDLYQLHGGTLEDPFDEIIEAFEKLQDAGKIRFYGISSIRPNIIRKYGLNSSLSSVMTQYSVFDRRPEEETLKFLSKKNIGVLVRGALAQGLLVNKPAKEYLGISKDQVSSIQQKVNRIAATKGAPESVSIHYALHTSGVSSLVCGIRNRSQLTGLIQGYQAEPLSEKEYLELQNMMPGLRYEQHR